MFLKSSNCHLSSIIYHLSLIVCHLSSHLYICRESSTNQLLFMQNKPNFRKAKMFVKSYITKDYENISNWTLGQNKPNSNPIKTNFRKAQMNVNLTLTKDYRKKDDFAVRKNKPNSNPNKANLRKNECKLLCYRVL